MMATYAEITEITPSSAVPGSAVQVQIKIINKGSITITFMAVAFHSKQAAGEYITGLYPYTATANVPAGSTYTFTGTFVMPSESVVINAYSYYYGVDGMYHLDDTKTQSVAVIAQPTQPDIAEFKISDYVKV
jgi:hypothetical protein